MIPTFNLDPHVFLGRVANGEKMNLQANNPSGTLWTECWTHHADGYHWRLVGPYGADAGPLTYEEAYKKVIHTMKILQSMAAEDARYL